MEMVFRLRSCVGCVCVHIIAFLQLLVLRLHPLSEVRPVFETTPLHGLVSLRRLLAPVSSLNPFPFVYRIVTFL